MPDKTSFLSSSQRNYFLLDDIFCDEAVSGDEEVFSALRFNRIRRGGVAELLLDRFDQSDAQCVFLRFINDIDDQLVLYVRGCYQIQAVTAGGWLLSPDTNEVDSYWFPRNPVLRSLDQDGHILSQSSAGIAGFTVNATSLAITLNTVADKAVDLVVWRIPFQEFELVRSLKELSTLELQRYFLWSSHTTYSRPADLYLHLVHGHVYENHEVWPKYWRVCSELDAYALYVTLTGLLRATGKRLYDLLRTQVVFSVIARQAEDGGWYHGEWTDQMESHYRLHAGAMHMLSAYYQETGEPVVGASLERAATFAAGRTERLDIGIWYLHDSLEANSESIQKYPFRIEPSRALGKSFNNLLVLNTHLDTNIAMERHRRVSGDARHAELIASAAATTRAIVALRPAEWLYRTLYRAIGLTFLPTEQAQKLPVLQRAIKRLAWKYLAPRLPRIKAWFPRLVMPGGYIERDLVQYGPSVRYQPVNLMDLVRTRRLFDDPGLDPLLRESFSYTRSSGLTRRWKEARGREDDSLGFWAEALYYLCLSSPEALYRAWLAEAMLDLEDNGLGQSPSLLGANAEAIPPADQRPCPIPTDASLRLANLSRGGQVEWLAVNPGDRPIPLKWLEEPCVTVVWRAQDGKMPNNEEACPVIPLRGWLYGRST